MHVTPEVVATQRDWVAGSADRIVPIINDLRDALGEAFNTDVRPVDRVGYEAAVEEVFAEGDRAVNVAGLVGFLRELDVADDYPGFIVDEVLGRELAAIIAGEQPQRLLAEATFHFADVHVHRDGPAGMDDLDAALAAGFQTRLPGWPWQDTPSPFDPED